MYKGNGVEYGGRLFKGLVVERELVVEIPKSRLWIKCPGEP